MALYDTSIRRPVATTMSFLVVIVVGAVSFYYLPVDLLPEIEYPQVSVTTSYPNVGPEEMEQIITDPVANAVSSVSNVERITSQSSEGSSRVNMEFGQGTDLNAAANDVRAALDRIRDDLPVEAEPPSIRKFDPNSQEIVSISVESRRDLPSLTRLMERNLSKQFEQIPGVGTINVQGGIYRQVQVNLNRERLMSYDLSAAQVQQSISSSNVALPGGNVKEGLKNLYVRTQGEYESLDEIRNTVVTTANGTPVRVQDVAEVIDGYEDLGRIAELNGIPVLRLDIQKRSGANTVSVANRVREEVKRVNQTRSDLNLTVVSDQSDFIRKSINNVQSSAIWGSLLAILVLYLFLRNGSTTFIIALSIPISIIATFALLFFNDLTLNQMTFGGLALGVGLIVDNAIVVLENIIRQREENGRSLREAASMGTREVAGAILASTITTSVIFLPLVFARTTTASLFQSLALVVVFALACSLLVALTLVPMMASRFLTVDAGEGDAAEDTSKSWFQRAFASLENQYSDAIRAALQRRWLVFGATGALLVGALLLWPYVSVELAPQTDANQIDVDMQMAQGTNIAVVMKYLEELEQRVQPMLPQDEVENFAKQVQPWGAEVEVQLKSAEERSINTFALADSIRSEVVGKVPGADLRVSAQSGLWILRRVFSVGGGNEALRVQLRGYDLEQAQKLAQRVKQELETVEGVAGARSGRREGQPEQNIRFLRDKISSLGLTTQEVARAVQTNLGGSRAASYRTGGEQFPITVRLRPEDRLSVQDLDNVSIQTPDGNSVPLSTLVTTQRGRGPTEIQRINGQRVTYISANLTSDAVLGEVVNRARQKVSTLSLPEGFSVTFGGQYREQQKAQTDFLIAIFMALVLIYMVMAGQFERFLDPLIVMFSVPLVLVGVLPTLVFTGTTVNIQSVMGFVMLIGIVVNNAIVLVDYINLMRRDRDLPLTEAVAEAGRLRLRPILMTTLTTVLGLVPLALGIGAGAEIQAALARVVIGGLTASTLITLLLIPVAYVSLELTARTVRSKLPDWSWLPDSTVQPRRA
ncbi:efflux RND transporter permease subunit [Salinibacter ruber]|jgi:HAE1 family hydrophobic/amphiphilic exporter-1|uniref:HAE1 family hydrophobic/amphiphilic exporter-1 n=1 Tax=Salinibacter ruber TaxID=146919 RepID=A0A9X2U0Q8_9BACT|nr:efflux RND transporter permease subunit [Salinibacter ruber]MBB4090639.1 HAE1 family hydrophobic/amphiphilic exporter-1 [Salinibacter ruber]MCS3612121.1 HAE1 family hydrophobic/amphiphilic exporter-1 [Salinibacter ruber]MCS3615179.1 HAE1 family hydrophobic/amphiphilic exporter-1 [Salinibacter ruber]MCS3657898.1 HAE1 family hydrophobic/amphiphilic exporter-1 [Salinibacter ruber]MCS3674822.1 HAE1 family hydrophobic/amphiphilic exporter-1 [Salinibacter ruber]